MQEGRQPPGAHGLGVRPVAVGANGREQLERCYVLIVRRAVAVAVIARSMVVGCGRCLLLSSKKKWSKNIEN